jgi:uridylate kinase
MSKKKVVISIGGSILVPGNDDASFIKELAALIVRLKDEVQMVVVCGGGRIARYYTRTAGELGADTPRQDLLGIGVTRLNAGLLALALGDAAVPGIPESAAEAAAMSVPGRAVVMGGTVPGHTTDAVAAMVAREMGADRIVNATSVDAVYSADPRTDGDAVRFRELTIGQLKDLVYDDHGAGRSSVFDPLGVRIATEEMIDILIVNGRDLEDLGNAILGNGINGTLIDSQERS